MHTHGNRHCFPKSSVYSFRPPRTEVPTPGQPSGPKSGPSLGPDTLCQGRGKDLLPNPTDRSSYLSCAGGRLFQQSCPSLVFSSSYKCCTWSGVPKAPSATVPRPEPRIPPQPASPALPGGCSLALQASLWPFHTQALGSQTWVPFGLVLLGRLFYMQHKSLVSTPLRETWRLTEALCAHCELQNGSREGREARGEGSIRQHR